MRFAVTLWLVAVVAGCQSTNTTIGTQVDLPPDVSHGDLVRASQRDLDSCITAFYKDDWKTVTQFSDQFVEIGRRWQALAVGQRETGYEQSAQQLHEAAKKLSVAANAEDVQATNESLRLIAKQIARLKELTPDIDHPPAPVEEKTE